MIQLAAITFKLAKRMALYCLLPTACCLLFSTCRRDMQDQPKAIAYRQSTFFKDGMAARPPVEGTVPRGYLRADREFYFGKKSSAKSQTGPSLLSPAGAPA